MNVFHCVNCTHHYEDEFGLTTCDRITINTENGYPLLQMQDGTQEPVAVPEDFGCVLWEEA